MTYSDQTPFYGIPLVKTGDQINAADEKIVFQIIENQLKAGIMGAGTTRVFKEGSYLVTNGAGNVVSVSLAGNPSLVGIANYFLIETNAQIAWFNLQPNQFYYLYVQSVAATKYDATQFTTVTSTTPLDSSSLLFLATLDNRVPGAPVIDTAPAGKPTGSNLYDLLNSPVNPFGSSLSQSNLTVTVSMILNLSRLYPFLITQASSTATNPVISITNASTQPEIYSSGELKLADGRLTAGAPLTDTVYYSLPRGSTSVMGALNVLTDTRLKRATISSNATSSFQTIIGVNDTSSSWTVTLATSTMVDGKIYIIKDESGAAATHPITITSQVPATNKIDGASSVTISSNYGVVRLYASSNNWFTF